MRKEEFLQGLRAALEGEVPAGTIQENLRYYNGYIDSEVQSGRKEEDVIEEIGEPQWIAKTIIDVTPEEQNIYEAPNHSDSTYEESPFSGQGNKGIHFYDLNKWYVKLAVAAVLLFIFWLVFTIIGGVLSLLSPILLPVALVALVMWLIRGPRR